MKNITIEINKVINIMHWYYFNTSSVFIINITNIVTGIVTCIVTGWSLLPFAKCNQDDPVKDGQLDKACSTRREKKDADDILVVMPSEIINIEVGEKILKSILE